MFRYNELADFVLVYPLKISLFSNGQQRRNGSKERERGVAAREYTDLDSRGDGSAYRSSTVVPVDT